MGSKLENYFVLFSVKRKTKNYCFSFPLIQAICKAKDISDAIKKLRVKMDKTKRVGLPKAERVILPERAPSWYYTGLNKGGNRNAWKIKLMLSDGEEYFICSVARFCCLEE